MASFGEHLKQIRENKGYSLETFSQLTKINAHALADLEAERFDRLPGGVFSRGFIKSYARFCGVDSQELLKEYEAAWAPGKSPEMKDPYSERPATPLGSFSTETLVIGGAVILVLIGTLIGVVYHTWAQHSISTDVSSTEHSGERAEVPPAETPSGTAGAPSGIPPVLPSDMTGGKSPSGDEKAGPSKDAHSTGNPPAPAGSGSTPVGSPAAKNENPLEKSLPNPVSPANSPQAGTYILQISATEAAWISVKRDGVEVFRRILRPNETVKFNAKGRFDVLCGNAGGISISIDGKTVSPWGRRGEVKSQVFERSAPNQ
ncbi:MAG: DUF4115 domain-containing protein [Acidobacteriia bacterium]|nr:DUF4115 domain-containing protein [Terriglobia bacterium]